MSKTARVGVYRDSSGEWRWSAHAKNGEKIASSGEGYENRAHAIEMATGQHPDAELIVHDRQGGTPKFVEDGSDDGEWL